VAGNLVDHYQLLRRQESIEFRSSDRPV